MYCEFLHGVWGLKRGRRFFERRGRKGYAEDAKGTAEGVFGQINAYCCDFHNGRSSQVVIRISTLARLDAFKDGSVHLIAPGDRKQVAEKFF